MLQVVVKLGQHVARQALKDGEVMRMGPRSHGVRL